MHYYVSWICLIFSQRHGTNEIVSTANWCIDLINLIIIIITRRKRCKSFQPQLKMKRRMLKDVQLTRFEFFNFSRSWKHWKFNVKTVSKKCKISFSAWTGPLIQLSFHKEKNNYVTKKKKVYCSIVLRHKVQFILKLKNFLVNFRGLLLLLLITLLNINMSPLTFTRRVGDVLRKQWPMNALSLT